MRSVIYLLVPAVYCNDASEKLHVVALLNEVSI